MHKKFLFLSCLFFLLISSSQVSSGAQLSIVKIPQLPLADSSSLDWEYFQVDWADITIWIEQENPSASFISTSENQQEIISLSEATWEIDKKYQITVFASFDLKPAIHETFPWGDYKYEWISIDNFTIGAELDIPNSLIDQEITFTKQIQRSFMRDNAVAFTFHTTFNLGFSSTWETNSTKSDSAILNMVEFRQTEFLPGSLYFNLFGSKLMYSPHGCVCPLVFFNLRPWSLNSTLKVYSLNTTPTIQTTSHNSQTLTSHRSFGFTLGITISFVSLLILIRRKRKEL